MYIGLDCRKNRKKYSNSIGISIYKIYRVEVWALHLCLHMPWITQSSQKGCMKKVLWAMVYLLFKVNF